MDMRRHTAAVLMWTILLVLTGTTVAWAQEFTDPAPVEPAPVEPAPVEPPVEEPPATEPPAPQLTHSEQKRVEHWRRFREKHPELYERKLENNKSVRALMEKAGEVPTPGTEPAPGTATTARTTRGKKATTDTTTLARGKKAMTTRGKRSDLGSMFASVSRGQQRTTQRGGGRDFFSAFGGGRSKGGGKVFGSGGRSKGGGGGGRGRGKK